MLQYGQLVLAQEENLRSLVPSRSAVTLLLNIAVELPSMSKQLRLGSCDKLKEQLCSSVKSTWGSVRSMAGTWESQQLHDLSRLLQECCSLYAMEAYFAEALEECGRLQKTASEQAVVQGLLAEGEKLVKLLHDGPGEGNEAVHSMSDYVDGIDMTSEKLTSEEKDRLKTVVLAIGSFANSAWHEGGELPDSSIVSLQLMHKIDKYLGNAVLSLQVKGLSEGVAVQQAQLAVTTKMCNGGAEYLDEELLLHHRCLKFQTTLKSLADVDQIPMLLRLKGLVEGAENAFLAEKTSMMASLKTELAVKEKALAKLAGGAPNGADWLADFTSDKWEDLKARASETLTKVNPQELITSQSHLKEACQIGPLYISLQSVLHTRSDVSVVLYLEPLPALAKYEKYAGALDVATDADRMKEINSLLAKSFITKCSAVCLGFLSDAQEGAVSKEKLRSRVQAEIHSLRAQNIKESGTLHPLLLGKVQLALVMRFI
eukprot:6458877-Amphidinium_carterae.2